jgi:NADPH-dependent ferric siderophore reductase
MNHIIRAPVRVRHRPRLGLMRVTDVTQISPLMRRVTFDGPVLDGFLSASPDDHVKLFFPHPGQSTPDLPVPGQDGPVYLPGTTPPAMRDYTPRRFDTATGQLTIEFVLHGEGPGASWATQASPGQAIGIGGPRGSALIPEDYDTYLLAGDETALPAIARFLEEMRPGLRALVLIEAADAREFRHLPSAANAAVTWLYRDGARAGQSGILEAALRAVMLPAGATHAWLAGEIETVRRMRAYLLAEEGFARGQIRAAGYWRLGHAGAHGQLED